MKESIWNRSATDWNAIPLVDLNSTRKAELCVINRSGHRAFIQLSLALAFFSATILPALWEVRDQQSRLSGLKTDVAGTNKQIDALEKQRGTMDDRLIRWKKFASSRTQRLAWSETLQGVASRMPSDGLLDSITMESSEKGKKLVLMGTFMNGMALQRYTESLVGLKGLDTVRLAEALQDTSAGNEALKFKVEGISVPQNPDGPKK